MDERRERDKDDPEPLLADEEDQAQAIGGHGVFLRNKETPRRTTSLVFKRAPIHVRLTTRRIRINPKEKRVAYINRLELHGPGREDPDQSHEHPHQVHPNRLRDRCDRRDRADRGRDQGDQETAGPRRLPWIQTPPGKIVLLIFLSIPSYNSQNISVILVLVAKN